MRHRFNPTMMGSDISKQQAGLTLVEIMVSLTIGLLVLLAVGSVYIGSRQTYRVQENNARIQEAGKYALEVIGRSIRQSGADEELSFTTLPDTRQCNVPAVCVAINGSDGPASDTMAVQFYAGREELNGAAWITRDCTGGAAAVGAVITNTFDLNGNDLRCTGSVGGTQALISDIEDFQVLYGIDTDPPNQPGSQSADRYVATPANWAQVVTARVCITVRSANDGLTSAAQTYLNCEGALGRPNGGAATTLAGDRRLHRSFVATYNLRNRISRIP